MAEEQKTPVIVVSTDEIPGYEISEVEGLVWASSVRAKSIFRDIKAMLNIISGGEIKEYHNLINETRHDIIRQLISNARKLNANAVIGLSISTSQIVPGTIEVLAYGTAVIAVKKNL